MNKRILKKLAVGTLGAGLTLTSVACGNDSNTTAGAEGKTEISVLFGKNEVIEEFEELAEVFNDSQEDIHVTVIPTAGQTVFERASTLYAGGNAPTISHMPREVMTEFEDKLLDLSGEPFEELAMDMTLESVRIDDKLLGMPSTVEGFGFIYNKGTIEEALGEEFHSEDIRTRNDLEELFEKLDAAEGIDPLHVSPIDWSLGNHLTNVFVASQSPDFDSNLQFLDDLIVGDVELADNEVYQGWLETFELMNKYNSTKDSPLDPDYDDGILALADGDVGLWFMGNWTYPELAEINPDAEFGFIPVPISNNPDDFGNNQLSIDVPQYWVVDAEQSTEEQQQAAKEFLNWMITDETAQDYFVNKLNFIPIFENMNLLPEDRLSLDMLDFMENENTLYWMLNYYPADAYHEISDAMQQYMAGVIDADELTVAIQDYWRNVQQ